MARIITLFIFLPLLSQAQVSIADDSLLQKLAGQLPSDWMMVTKGNQLIIAAKDSVWERYNNKINLADEKGFKPHSEEETFQLFKKEGHKTLSRRVYKLDRRWSRWEVAEAWRQNDSINRLISTLMDKYRITALYRKEKGEDHFAAKTADEKEHVRKYWEERKNLEAAIIRYPYLNSQKYSLIEISVTGCGDAYTDIWPGKADLSCRKVSEIIEDLLYTRLVYR